MKITFLDVDGKWGDSLRSKFGNPLPAGIGIVRTRVENYPRKAGMAFVSPANSLGFMDGGIDRAYSTKMFPGIEAEVKKAVRTWGKDGHIHSKFLPVGWAVAVRTGEKGVDLIVAPTMLTPQDVQNTDNAYGAMRAALAVAHNLGVSELVVPGLCTGWGCMSWEKSAEQVFLAWSEPRQACYVNGVYRGPEIPQPLRYENTAFYAP